MQGVVQALADEFTKMAFDPDLPGAKSPLLKLAQITLPSLNEKRLSDLENVFSDNDVKESRYTYFEIDRFKSDYYGDDPVPDSVYEYLVNFPFLANFPDMVETLSDDSKKIAHAVDDFFDGKVNYAIENPDVRFALLLRIHMQCYEMYEVTKYQAGTKNDICDSIFEKVSGFAVEAGVMDETELEYKIRSYLQDARFFRTLIDADRGWYLPLGLKHFAGRDKVDLSFFDDLNVPSNFTGILKDAYVDMVEPMLKEHGYDALDTFHYFCENVMRPFEYYYMLTMNSRSGENLDSDNDNLAEETQKNYQSYAPYDDIGSITALFYSAYKEGFLSDAVKSSLKKYTDIWDKCDSGNTSELDASYLRSFNMGRMAIVHSDLFQDFTRVTYSSTAWCHESDLERFRNSIEQVPSEVYGVPINFLMKLRDFKQEAIKLYNFHKSAHDLPIYHQTPECFENDNHLNPL